MTNAELAQRFRLVDTHSGHVYPLDKPLPLRYLIYLEHVLQGDLGQSSLTHNAVTSDLGTFIPATGELALYSILFAAIVGVTFGVVSALRSFPRNDSVMAPRRECDCPITRC